MVLPTLWHSPVALGCLTHLAVSVSMGLVFGHAAWPVLPTVTQVCGQWGRQRLQHKTIGSLQ